MRACKNCCHYTDETRTPTGIGIAYCDTKESRRYNTKDGSIRTVVYEDGKCKYWSERNIEGQVSFL